MGCPFSQGIGLRPQPRAWFSRPVGPVGSLITPALFSQPPQSAGEEGGFVRNKSGVSWPAGRRRSQGAWRGRSWLFSLFSRSGGGRWEKRAGVMRGLGGAAGGAGGAGGRGGAGGPGRRPGAPALLPL